jgi:heat shock protein beta
MGWSANMARIMASQAGVEDDPMYDMMKNLPKVLEINPKSPLIEGLLERVLDLSAEDEDEGGSADVSDLRETVRVLFDTALVRSGFSVADPTSYVDSILSWENGQELIGGSYFERVEALLRRSLGVSLTAKSKVNIRPAPPTAMGPIGEDGVNVADDAEGSNTPFGNMAAGGGEEWMDWQAMKGQYEAGDDDESAVETVHDEL